ncbi:MAG: peptidase G2 autoproteolytic cleavage domain-containing protein [Dehalococcoidales bacterium]
MAEIQPSDIGLATFNDVGDVANLQTNAKEIVSAINEVLASGGGVSSGEQIFMEGEDNTVIGGGNIIFGNGNRVFGSGNLIVGDNHLIIGSNKTVAKYIDISTEWYDYPAKKIYFYYFGEDNIAPIPSGTTVSFSLQQTWVDANWTDWFYVESKRIITTVVDFNVNGSYIEVAEMPELSFDPPDDVHTILDFGYVLNFIVLSEEYKKNGNGSLSMGGTSMGVSSISGNGANASGNYSAGFNAASSKGYGTFAANSSYAEGNYAFAVNQGRTYSEYSTALNTAYTYSGYSCSLNGGRTCGRAIKCVSMNSSSGTITAAEGESLTGLSGATFLVRYKNSYNTIIYNTKMVTSISGRVLSFAEGFGGSGYSLMPDGYIFRVEVSNGHNMATGYGVTGNKYSQAHGLYTLCVHEGATIYGKYGVSPGNYSWSLANGTSFSDMALAIKILQNGDIHTDGTLSSPCADYAEFFEWQDGNPNGEDRAGYFVKLIGDKIVKTDDFDNPIGIISAMPAIIGDSGEMHWQGKFVTDDFGRVQYHDVVIPEEKDDEGNIIVEEHTQRQPILNPNWDSAQEYIPRQNRPEWATVGVLGKLIVYDDGTLKSGDLCRCGNGGIAVKSVNNGYPVLKRIAEDKVLIWFK